MRIDSFQIDSIQEAFDSSLLMERSTIHETLWETGILSPKRIANALSWNFAKHALPQRKATFEKNAIEFMETLLGDLDFNGHEVIELVAVKAKNRNIRNAAKNFLKKIKRN